MQAHGHCQTRGMGAWCVGDNYPHLADGICRQVGRDAQRVDTEVVAVKVERQLRADEPSLHVHVHLCACPCVSTRMWAWQQRPCPYPSMQTHAYTLRVHARAITSHIVPGVSPGVVTKVTRPPRKQSERSVTRYGGGAGGGDGGDGGGGGGNGRDGTQEMIGSVWNGGVASKPKHERRSDGMWWLNGIRRNSWRPLTSPGMSAVELRARGGTPPQQQRSGC